jgi:hypothetical protein
MRRGLNPRFSLRRVRVTPATVIATIALVLAAGGGAYATTSAGGTVEWAVIKANGHIARSSGAVGSSQLTHNGKPVPGSYRVLFLDDVRNCAYKATLGNALGGVPPVGDVGVSHMTGVVNGVFVHTTNAKGSPVNEGFHVAVVC